AARVAALSGLADIALHDGTPEAAVPRLQQALAADSTSASSLVTWNNLGYALVKAGRAAEARAVLDRALRRFAALPERIALLKNAARAALAMDDVDGAFTAVQTALAQDHEYAPAVGWLAASHARRGALAHA